VYNKAETLYYFM